jgi:hypothetical protein
MRDGTRAAAVVLAAVAQIAGSPVGTALAGRSVGDVSDDTRSLITPAGWAFTIWGLIFAGCLAWAVYQALPGRRDLEVHRRPGWPLAAAFAGNAVWEVLFPLIGASQPLVPLALLFGIVAATAVAFARLQDLQVSGPARLLPRAVTGLLLGWVTVAAAVAVGSTGVALGADASGTAATAWAVVALGGVALVAAGIVLVSRAAAGPFALAVVWGLSAIAVAADPVPVTVAAVLAAVVVVAAVVLRAVTRPEPGTLLVG